MDMLIRTRTRKVTHCGRSKCQGLLEKVVRGIADAPEGLDISSGRAPDEALLVDAEVLHVMEPYDPALLEPYLPALRSVL